MLPLAHRLPNPPPVFFGRDAEARALADLITRAPVTHLQGLGGLGKSALVAHVLHRLLPDRAARAVVARVRPGEDLRAILVDVVRALAAAEGVHLSSWQAHLADPQLALATALDHADAGRWTVVLEDLHHLASPADRAALLEPLATYARDARWVVTSREAPPAGLLAGQELTLGPLGPAAVLALAAAWAPDRREADRAVAAAGSDGAPWRLRQALFGAPAAPGPADPLAGLAPDPRAALETLALLERPLPEAALVTLPAVTRPALDLLVRSGHLEATGVGLAAHALSRSLTLDALGARTRDLAGALVPALVTAGLPEAALEALRLAREHAPDTLAELAQAVAPALTLDGFAPEAWHLLAATGPALPLATRLHLALEAGDLDAALALGPPAAEEGPDAALAWARALYAANRFLRAAEAAETLARSGAPLAAEACLVAGRARLVLGDPAAALALVDPPPPAGDPVARQLVEDIRICALNALGRGDEARVSARRLAAELDLLPPAGRRQVGHYLVRSLYELGLLREASRVLTRTLGELGPRALSLQVGRGALFSEAVIALENGRLADATAAVDRLQAYFPPSAGAWHAMRETLATQLALFGPSFDPERLTTLLAAGHLYGAHAIVATVRMQEVRWALEAGTAELPWAAADLDGGDPHTRIAHAWASLHATRHGAPRAAPPPSDSGRQPGEAAFVHQLAAATSHLTRGEVLAALSLAREAAAAAEAQGYGILAPEAWELVLWAEACLGRPLSDLAGRYLAMTEAMPAARLVARARLYAECARGPAADAAVLFDLARRADLAAGRRARAILGDRAPLDRAEALVTEALARLVAGPERFGWLGPPDGSFEWLIDRPRQSVGRPDGEGVTSIDLSRTPQLFRLLATLAAHGGEADKETLVCAAWGLTGYHPLHHDNRLRVAAKKLRQLIEPTPSSPTLLVTTEDGYRLGGHVLVAT